VWEKQRFRKGGIRAQSVATEKGAGKKSNFI